MENETQPSHSFPRILHYRNHYKYYLIALLTSVGFVLFYWGIQLNNFRWYELWQTQSLQLWGTLTFLLFSLSFYFFWLRHQLNKSVKVFEDYILIHQHGKEAKILFSEIENYAIVCWSVFYFKTKDGVKHYFSSSLERVDYVWEGFYKKCPHLLQDSVYEEFKIKLVQYDHHQKRKEWFFKHKTLDVFNWFILPVSYLFFAYIIQARELQIHQTGMYFFRLFMYTALILSLASFLYSLILKKFVFDRNLLQQMQTNSDAKRRDLVMEDIIIHRSKLLQITTAIFFFAMILKHDLNFYSFTQIKEDLAVFNLKSGSTLKVDNRYNCINCKYSISDGDIVLFGKGTIGQVVATEGDMVGQFLKDHSGRVIASDNVEEVPVGYVAIKLANQREIMIVKTNSLIGKLKK